MVIPMIGSRFGYNPSLIRNLISGYSPIASGGGFGFSPFGFGGGYAGGNRTMDFRDQNKDGTDDRDQGQRSNFNPFGFNNMFGGGFGFNPFGFGGGMFGGYNPFQGNPFVTHHVNPRDPNAKIGLEHATFTSPVAGSRLESVDLSTPNVTTGASAGAGAPTPSVPVANPTMTIGAEDSTTGGSAGTGEISSEPVSTTTPPAFEFSKNFGKRFTSSNKKRGGVVGKSGQAQLRKAGVRGGNQNALLQAARDAGADKDLASFQTFVQDNYQNYTG